MKKVYIILTSAAASGAEKRFFEIWYKLQIKYPIYIIINKKTLAELILQLKIDKSIKVDFFINCDSMMEMTRDNLNKYFDLMHAHISPNGFFLNINRDVKSVFRTGDKRKEAFYFYDYPYDNNWDVIISKPCFNQPLKHLMLTQRKYEKFRN